MCVFYTGICAPSTTCTVIHVQLSFSSAYHIQRVHVQARTYRHNLSPPLFLTYMVHGTCTVHLSLLHHSHSLVPIEEAKLTNSKVQLLSDIDSIRDPLVQDVKSTACSGNGSACIGYLGMKGQRSINNAP